MDLAEAKTRFHKEHPNLMVTGWDERDYKLWGKLFDLNGYGLVAGEANNPLIARKDVIALIEQLSRARFEREWRERYGIED